MTIQITITQRILVNVVADKISQNSTTGFRLLRRAHTLEAQNFTTIQVTISTEMTITMQRKTNLPLNTKIELVKSIAVVYLWSFYLHFSLRENTDEFYRIHGRTWQQSSTFCQQAAMYSVS